MAQIFVSTSATLILRLYDNTAASGTLLIASVTVAAKDNLFLPAHFTTGLYVEFVSGTGAVSVFYI